MYKAVKGVVESIAMDEQTKYILERTGNQRIEGLLPYGTRHGFGADGEPRDPEVIENAARLAKDVPNEDDYRRHLCNAVFLRIGDPHSRAIADDYDKARILNAGEEAVKRLIESERQKIFDAGAAQGGGSVVQTMRDNDRWRAFR